jgi:hypothetical protein
MPTVFSPPVRLNDRPGLSVQTSRVVIGRNDSVGILSNAFPFTVALYNLRLSLKLRRSLGNSRTPRSPPE